MQAMDRRDALKTTTAIALAPVLLPAESQRLVTAPGWKPQLFTPHQNETVIVLTELIIPTTDTPGAKQALVNRYIDLLLKDGPARERERFLAGLQWLDEYSRKQEGSEFVKLSPSKQVAVLEKLDSGDDPELKEGHTFFRMAKALTARLYYQTEIGYKELNKRGVPGGFGCKDAPHKA